MSVKREINYLNQMRLDVPDFKSLESSIKNDFDELISSVTILPGESYVIRGFKINLAGAIGASANSLQMIVENSAILHGSSNESGTFFVIRPGVPNETISPTTNEKVDGSFTPNAINYVGIEFTKEVDDTTVGQRYFYNPTTKNEFSKSVPLAKVFDFKIVISSVGFDSNVLPIALVRTDAANNVTNVTDRRPMLYRLGSAGNAEPNPDNEYVWSGGRDENPSSSSSSTSSPFIGGDKEILSGKQWMDAIMSIIKEVTGLKYWYSETQNISLFKLKADLANTSMTGSGVISHDAVTPGKLNWSSTINFDLIGSRLSYTLAANTSSSDVVLANNQAAYIKLVRDVAIVPKLIFTNGSAVVTSVGAVAWTSGLVAGDFVKSNAFDQTKYYKILSVDSASQVTLTENYGEASSGALGEKADYAWGQYSTDPAPTTDRHVKIENRQDVPFDGDVLLLFYRQDNGATPARVYIAGSKGGELEQGEDIEISDNTTLEVLAYIGSQGETDDTPDYTNSIVTGVEEDFTVSIPSSANITSGDAWDIYAPFDQEEFAVWYNLDGAGGNPLIPGKIMLEVAVSTGNTAAQNAALTKTVLDTTGWFLVTDNMDGTLDIINTQVGDTTDAANRTMGVGFSVTINTQGAGSPNRVVVDDDNLTKTAKKLDQAVAALQDALDQENYREFIEVVAGAPANDNEITGPVPAGTLITIPLNSRDADRQEQYEVGLGELVVYLNGIRIGDGGNYLEVGSIGDLSTQIEWNESVDLQVGDIIEFKKEIPAGGAGGSGGGGAYTGANLGTPKDGDVFAGLSGNQFNFRRLESGAGVTVSQSADTITISASGGSTLKNVRTVTGVNSALTLVDDFVAVFNAGVDVTITLPDATTSAGKVFDIKKAQGMNILYVASVLNQTIDGTNATATPLAISILNESLRLISDGVRWFII